jgi:hypothetical protein
MLQAHKYEITMGSSELRRTVQEDQTAPGARTQTGVVIISPSQRYRTPVNIVLGDYRLDIISRLLEVDPLGEQIGIGDRRAPPDQRRALPGPPLYAGKRSLDTSIHRCHLATEIETRQNECSDQGDRDLFSRNPVTPSAWAIPWTGLQASPAPRTARSRP